MTWEALHNRGEVLRRVLVEVGERRNGLLPMDLPGVDQTFDDELDLLGALQLRWYARLSGKIEAELADQPMDLEAAVVTAWRTAAEELPGVRAVVDHYREHPVDDEMAAAMTKAAAKEHQLLAVMAGQVSATGADAHGAKAGTRIEQSARAGLRLPEPRPASGARLVDRLRAALAA